MIIAQNNFKMGYIAGLFQFGSGIDPTAPKPGDLIQLVTSEQNVPANATNPIPIDDTIPTNLEGTAYDLDTSITPKKSTSSLVIRVFIPIVTCGASGNFVGALYRDSVVSALGANAITIGVVNQQYAFELLARAFAGSTSPTTFKFRFGPATAITAYILSSGTATGFYNGRPAAYMSIMEIAA